MAGALVVGMIGLKQSVLYTDATLRFKLSFTEKDCPRRDEDLRACPTFGGGGEGDARPGEGERDRRLGPGSGQGVRRRRCVFMFEGPCSKVKCSAMITVMISKQFFLNSRRRH